MSELFDAEVTVRRTRYASDEHRLGGARAADADGDHVVLVGPLIHLEERERARVVGTWVDDSRYGPQVKVTEATPLPPADAEALVAYLRRVKHVGRKRAARLVERHGAAAVLERSTAIPEAAFAAVGVTRARAREAAESWNALRVTRQLHLLLAPHGLGVPGRARARRSTAPPPTASSPSSPYELTSVFGVGFAIADRIARRRRRASRIARSSARGRRSAPARRGRAQRQHVPAGTRAGRRRCASCSAPIRPRSSSRTLERDGEVVREGDWIYRAATAALEAELAERIERAPGQRTGGDSRSPPTTARRTRRAMTRQLPS